MEFQNDKMFRTIAVYFTILFLGLMSVPFTHAESFSFVKQGSAEKTGDRQFSSQVGIAVGSHGNQ
jgi:hypothetical protein